MLNERAQPICVVVDHMIWANDGKKLAGCLEKSLESAELTPMEPWFLSVGDGLAILERAFSEPGRYCRLQRIIIRRVALSRLAFIKCLALAGPVLSRGMTKRNRSGGHLVGPEQGVGCEVSVPGQRL